MYVYGRDEKCIRNFTRGLVGRIKLEDFVSGENILKLIKSSQILYIKISFKETGYHCGE